MRSNSSRLQEVNTANVREGSIRYPFIIVHAPSSSRRRFFSCSNSNESITLYVCNTRGEGSEASERTNDGASVRLKQRKETRKMHAF